MTPALILLVVLGPSILILTSVLAFSFNPTILRVSLFAIGIGSFLASWIYAIHSSTWRLRVSVPFLSEPLIIFASIAILSMSYLFPTSLPSGIANFEDLHWFNYVYGIVCISIVSTVPGRLISSFFLHRDLGILPEFLVSFLLSLISVFVISAAFYWGHLDFLWLKFAFIFFIISLGTAHLLKNKRIGSLTSLIVRHKLDLSIFNVVFLNGVISVILVSMSVMLSNEFMIPGDAWLSLKPGVIALKSLDIFEYFSDVEYPVVWGVFMAGLSSVGGMPVLNTNVIVFPFTALSISAFYVLSKYLFRIQGRVLITALVFFGFSGGLGWIASNFLLFGDFWELSYKTQDMYFHSAFWNNLMFTHKTLALSLTLMSLVTFSFGLKFKFLKQRVFLICVSALFLSFAFYLHMIEVLIGIPILLVIAILHRKKVSKKTAMTYLVTVIGVFSLVNALLNGYYLWLIEQKVDTLFQMLSPQAALSIPLGLEVLGILPFLVLGGTVRGFLSKHYIWIIGGILSILYFVGPRMWISSPEYEGTLYMANALPWYFIPMRFGIVGMLAILSLFLDVRSRSWFRIGALWGIIALIIGHLWWGARTIDFIYPVVAIFAAFTFVTLIDKHLLIKKTRRKRIESIILCSFIGVICSSSYIYGLYETTVVRDRLSDLSSTTINAIKWINYNAPNNVGVVIPDQFNDQLAFRSFTSSNGVPLGQFSSNITSNTVDQEYLSQNNIQYIFASRGDIPQMQDGVTISPVFGVNETRKTGGMAELTPKGFNISETNSLTQGQSTCDWMDAADAEIGRSEGSASSDQSRKIIDHNAKTSWTGAISNSSVVIDLGSTKMLCSFVVSWLRPLQLSYDFTVLVSDDSENFTRIHEGTSTSSYFNFEEYNVPDITTRYLKINIDRINDNAPTLFKLVY